MRTAIIAALLLASCNRSDPASAPQANDDIAGEPTSWDLQSSGEGAALVVTNADGATAMRLFCPAGAGTLLVNVPAFTPIASEERLSFGQGGEATALVADPSGDKQRGGVSGEAAVPANLSSLLSGRVSASYGAQSSGPHPAPPAELVEAFVSACAEGKASEAPSLRRWRQAPTPAWSRTASRSRPTPSARSAPSRSGARASRGAASLTRTPRTSRALGCGRNFPGKPRTALGAVRWVESHS